MPDTNKPRKSRLAHPSLDEFLDVENDMRWSSEHIRSFGSLLGCLAIILATIVLGLFVG
jgi:hypothetical protein